MIEAKRLCLKRIEAKHLGIWHLGIGKLAIAGCLQNALLCYCFGPIGQEIGFPPCKARQELESFKIIVKNANLSIKSLRIAQMRLS